METCAAGCVSCCSPEHIPSFGDGEQLCLLKCKFPLGAAAAAAAATAAGRAQTGMQRGKKGKPVGVRGVRAIGRICLSPCSGSQIGSMWLYDMLRCRALQHISKPRLETKGDWAIPLMQAHCNRLYFTDFMQSLCVFFFFFCVCVFHISIFIWLSSIKHFQYAVL